MTAPEKIILDCKRWVDSNTGKFVNYSFEGEFRDADIYTTQDNVSYTRSDLYKAAQARIKELESQLALAKIASEPVYSRRQLEDDNAKLKAALNEAADYIEFLQGIINKSNMANDSEYMLHPDCPQTYRTIAGGKDETK